MISTEAHFRRFEYVRNHFKARPTDVIIASTPKSGTTWVQQILHQVRTKGTGSFDNINDVVAWLDTPYVSDSAEQLMEKYSRMGDPRVLKTHCVSETTPGVDVARIIAVSRDPRDCCVSRYYHDLNTRNREISFNEHFERWMKLMEWYRHIASWWRRREDANLLWIRYEEMIEDLPASHDRMCGFLGWTISDEEREEVLRRSSFAWMKSNARRFIPHDMLRPAEFIRKGTVGGHREVMTKRQSEAVLAKAKRYLAPDCLAFLGLDCLSVFER